MDAVVNYSSVPIFERQVDISIHICVNVNFFIEKASLISKKDTSLYIDAHSQCHIFSNVREVDLFLATGCVCVCVCVSQ